MARKLSKKALAEKKDRARRMKWWHDARFGMFIHWGLYSILGRHEWVQNIEQITVAENEALAAKWNPKPNCMREWAKLAKKAGMKYMVLTTKHHEGYCLWDSNVTDFCAGKTGPGRDLVAEYVAAARAEGLKVGFYYSLMDWHHPDGFRCAKNEPARRRFVDYTHALVKELMTKYGKIDILWYDVAHPLADAAGWESAKMNRMVRKLQPDIVINDRSHLPEDFGTPEESINAAEEGRAWEACMTFNGSWGFMDTPAEDWHSPREVVRMLHTCTAEGGNLLLNVGPHADGTLPQTAHDNLARVGKWLDTYGKKCVYGARPRTDHSQLLGSLNLLNWTVEGKTAYAWLINWPGREFYLGRWKGKVKSVKLLTPKGAVKLKFEQQPRRLAISGLPRACPDKSVGIAIVQITCASKPSRGMATHAEAAGHWK
ncbi:MAG: alpha-L-fucosidase [Planctomycetota bacterium]|jgi:alpha-L-fucosidase